MFRYARENLEPKFKDDRVISMLILSSIYFDIMRVMKCLLGFFMGTPTSSLSLLKHTDIKVTYFLFPNTVFYRQCQEYTVFSPVKK